MTIRRLTFPEDLDHFKDLIKRGFVNPDNPAWDETVSGMLTMVTTASRLWPVLRPMLPNLPDMFIALVWEEDGQDVGVVSAMTQSLKRERYEVSAAVTLPGYRQQGIAAQLTAAIIEAIKEAGGQMALATTIVGNTPVRKLAAYYGGIAYNQHAETLLPATAEVPLPAHDLTITQASGPAWEHIYQIATRITPDEMQAITPIQRTDFQAALPLRLILRIFNRLMGYNSRYYVAYQGGQPVGYTFLNPTTQTDAIHRLSVHIAEPTIATPLLHEMIATTRAINPTIDIAMNIPLWQPELRAAAESIGFTVQREWVHLAKHL